MRFVSSVGLISLFVLFIPTLSAAVSWNVPADAPTGELAADGLSKTFKVTAQVTGPATEIPAIAFSYFDPVKGHYQTIHSDPIAVSVKGGSVVGAGDVVAMAPKSGAKNAPVGPEVSVAVELALSSDSASRVQKFPTETNWTKRCFMELAIDRSILSEIRENLHSNQ